MSRRDYIVAMNLPYWDDELVMQDLFYAPPAWVGSLSEFAEADDVAILDGFGDLDGFCDVMEVVAPLAAVMGAGGCAMIEDKTDRRTCEQAAGLGASAAAILQAVGCSGSEPSSSTTPPSGPTPAEIEAARLRAQRELERQRAKERRNTLLLAGGGIAAVGIAAVIALK